MLKPIDFSQVDDGKDKKASKVAIDIKPAQIVVEKEVIPNEKKNNRDKQAIVGEAISVQEVTPSAVVTKKRRKATFQGADLQRLNQIKDEMNEIVVSSEDVVNSRG
jgi:hypothetical protein